MSEHWVYTGGAFLFSFPFLPMMLGSSGVKPPTEGKNSKTQLMARCQPRKYKEVDLAQLAICRCPGTSCCLLNGLL